MIGYIDSSSFPVYTYGEMVLSSPVSPVSKYYIWWTPSNISSGTFTMEGSTYNFSDYNGSFEFEGGIIQDSAFNNARSIQTLNTNAKEIRAYAFNRCVSLTQVSLPDCISIGKMAFTDCISLTQISLPVCPYIGDRAFIDCRSLTQIGLPVCSFIDDGAFTSCYSLSQVSLPVCSFIGNYVFQYCSSLTQIGLPVCSYIGYSAFANCSLLNTITLGWSSVCDILESLVFNKTGITSSTGSIFVPSSLVSVYKSTTHWSYFSDIIYPINN